MKKKIVLTMGLVCVGLCALKFAGALSYTYAPDAYETTKNVWEKTYTNLLKSSDTVRGTTYIAPLKGNGIKDRLHKNKARDTIVFVPETTTVDEPVDFIFYFHGLGGFKERDFKTRVLAHTTSINPNENYVIIVAEMPWSKNTLTPRKRQGQVFTKKKQFANFVKAVLEVVNGHFPIEKEDTARREVTLGSAILLGHSAGGSALMSISRSGGMDWLYKQLAEDCKIRIIFSDASYGRWLDIAWKYFESKTDLWNVEFIVLTRKHDSPYKHTKRFMKRLKTVPVNFEHVPIDRTTTHAGIGDESFKWIYYVRTPACCHPGEDYE